MRWIILPLAIIVLALFLYSGRTFTKLPPNDAYKFQSIGNMKIESPAFENGASIPARFTCDGGNINPSLIVKAVPENVQSLVLIVDDPDVPRSIRADGLWVHWIVFNIPPGITLVKEGESPPGVEGTNTGRKKGYTGPCPPDKEHRYFFKLYALDTMLDLTSGATKEDIEKAMENHVLAQAALVGVYERE